MASVRNLNTYPRRMRTDSSNRQQSSTIDWLAHPRSSWRCLVPRLLPRLAEDALAEPRSFWPAVGLGWRSCCWRRVCCAESVWEGPATEVMVRAPPPRTEGQHLERSSPVGQAGRYGPGVLQGGRSDRLRGECAAIRVLFGRRPCQHRPTTGRSIPHPAHTIPNGDGCLFGQRECPPLHQAWPVSVCAMRASSAPCGSTPADLLAWAASYICPVRLPSTVVGRQLAASACSLQ